MSITSELRQMAKPYYWFNILLSVSYMFAKKTPAVCHLVFSTSECELDGRETEILFFLMIVITLRTRKAGSVTMLNYLASAFVYTKIANLILWFYADVRMGLVFGAIVVLCGLLLPEPTYQGPENVIYFRGLQNMQEEVSSDREVSWLVCFYAAWHPACVNLAPVFSQISHKYHLSNLKFAKMDVGRFPDAAARYCIVDGPTSRQLPTLVLLQGGVERSRRPQADSKGKLIKFVFSEDNIKTAFDLPALYDQCKSKQTNRDTNKSNSKEEKKQQ